MSQAKTVKEFLVAAQWILENKGWCQGYYRKNAAGQHVYVDADAASFCSIGALWAVEAASPHLLREAETLLSKIVKKDVIMWNDTPGRTKEEILNVFEQAIKEAT